jgi:hypothetical protein
VAARGWAVALWTPLPSEPEVGAIVWAGGDAISQDHALGCIGECLSAHPECPPDACIGVLLNKVPDEQLLGELADFQARRIGVARHPAVEALVRLG